MPANLYGVANPLATAVRTGVIGSVDIVCNAGVETNCIDSGTIYSPSPGFFYPVVYYQIACQNGATPPSGLNFGVRIGAGADFTSIALPGALNTANYMWFFGGMTYGPISGSVWIQPGANIFITTTPVSQSVTFKAQGSFGQFFLFRAADQ